MSLINDDPVFQSLEKKVKYTIDSSANIEELIIQRAAEREAEAETAELKRSINHAIDNFSQDKLYPKFEFTNIREQGLKIWGKKDNLAISQYSMSQILHELASICNKEDIEKALYNAGCKSAFQFFSDFLPHLRNSHNIKLPENEIEFLRLMGSFDQRSSWWSEKPILETDDKYFVAILNKPFTKYPWTENDPHTFDAFLCGYMQTLFNCSSDFLRVISLAQDKRHISKYCLACTYEYVIKPELVYLKFFISDKYIPEFEDIDRLFFRSYNGFISGLNTKSNIDLFESFEYYAELIGAMKNAFEETITYDTNLLNELNKRKGSIQKTHEDRPDNLLIELKNNYQVLKIEKLMKLDSELMEVMNNANKGVD